MINLQGKDMFIIIIQFIISSSVTALFTAVAFDFIYNSRSSGVKKEKKSIVATGTMTGFFIVYYFVLISNAGIIPVKNINTARALAAAGTFMIFSGCIMNILGRFNLGKNWADQIKIYKEQSLVQSGMYKYVRHPLYASLFVMFYGGCLVYRSLPGFAMVTFIFVPFMYYRAKQEEMLLKEKFPEYENYKRKTGMFLPKIRRGGKYDK